jgi:hypothetical protein
MFMPGKDYHGREHERNLAVHSVHTRLDARP